MAYKFSFILKEAKDYMRRPEVEFFGLNADDLCIQYDPNGIVYIFEDVNRPKTDKVVKQIESQGFEVRVVSKAKHLDFEILDELEYIQNWINSPPTAKDTVSPVSKSL